MKTKLILLGVGLLSLTLYIFFSPSTLPVSPLGSPSTPHSSALVPNSFIIMGFAPYWNLKKLTPESGEGITHFAYFTLHLNASGGIYTHVNAREQDPGYTNFLRLLAKTIEVPRKPLILTFMPSDQDALIAIISSTGTRTQAVTSITSALRESGASGVNIDFEPIGDIAPSTRDNFTLFIKQLRSSLCPSSTNQCPLISISIYASAGTKPRIWDLSELTSLSDYFVVMAYDYTMPSTHKAGPNSPLRDAGDNFEHNIIKNIAEITNLVPSRQILLGIPLYGYEWDTVDESKYAPTESRGVTASLERIEQMLRERTLSLLWDRNSLTAYGVASKSGQISQIYFENETSLRLKLEFVKSTNLGGIALWALGYDRGVPWLWSTISTLNK